MHRWTLLLRKRHDLLQARVALRSGWSPAAPTLSKPASCVRINSSQRKSVIRSAAAEPLDLDPVEKCVLSESSTESILSGNGGSSAHEWSQVFRSQAFRVQKCRLGPEASYKSNKSGMDDEDLKSHPVLYPVLYDW